MSLRGVYKVALGLLCAAATVCLAWWLFTHEIGFTGNLLLGLGGVLLARWMVRAKLVLNPAGGTDRGFGFARVIRDVLNGAMCWVGAILWAYAVATAAKNRLIPDTEWTAYLVLGGPVLGFIVLGTFFMGRAGFRTMFGMPNVEKRQ